MGVWRAVRAAGLARRLAALDLGRATDLSLSPPRQRHHRSVPPFDRHLPIVRSGWHDGVDDRAHKIAQGVAPVSTPISGHLPNEHVPAVDANL
jgi:hypothetical protein